MLTHRSMVSTIAGVLAVIGGLSASDVYISYLPLAHIFERETVTGLLSCGASIGFYQVRAFFFSKKYRVSSCSQSSYV